MIVDGGVPCPACRSDDLEVIRRDGSVSGGMVSFPDELTRCTACGEEFYTYEQSMASSRAYATAIREAEQFPSPEAIRQTRLDLGMTQEQFERALGVGKKTVVRWERGTVPPSRAAGGMLWLAARHPEVFLEFARMINPDLEPPDEAIIATIFTAPGADASPVVVRSRGPKPRNGNFTARGFKTTTQEGGLNRERRPV